MQLNKNAPPVIFLMGPTASGKTGLAVELVQQLPCDIISVDSALVYRGMDIGTAKPDQELLRKAPHRLIDIREPTEVYSAAEFRHDAIEQIESTLGQGRIPLLVGGTMLYFRVLASGLSALPKADAAVRAAIEQDAELIGWQGLHAQLAEIDPEAGQRIHCNDPQRIQRALEVYRLTGRPMTALYAEQGRQALSYNVLKMIIAPDERADLHARIERRFNCMLERGFVAEVECLFNQAGMHEALPSMRTVGYRQLWSYLVGDCSLEQAVAKGIIATRQLAKRQMTWLRSESAGKWFDGADKNVLDKVLKSLKDALLI